MSDLEPRSLRAVPAEPSSIEPGKPVYADVTGARALRPVFPDWLRRGNFRAAVRIRFRFEVHRAAVHGVRLPVYAAKALFWGVVGSVWMGLLWLRWWLSPVPA